MFIFVLYFVVALLITVYSFLYHVVKVKIGLPPIGMLFIAYKYSLPRSQRNFKFIQNSVFSRKTHKLVKFVYYSETVNKVGFMEGVILSENGALPDGNSFKEVQKAGLNIFTTPAISHAISIEFPIFICFSITKLFAVLMSYPRINRISQANNLCAYPVMEIYSNTSVTVVVPLMQQDCFVVHEAENIVFGRSTYDVHPGYKTDWYRLFPLKENGVVQQNGAEKGMKSPKLHKRIMKG